MGREDLAIPLCRPVLQTQESELMGSIHQTMGQAWKVGTQIRNLGDREVPREKQPLHSLQGKIQCEMSCPLLSVLQL